MTSGLWARCGVVLAVLLAMATLVRGQDRTPTGEIDLRPKFEKGQTIRYLMETHSKITTAQKTGRPGQRPPAPSEPDPLGGALPRDMESKLSMGLTMQVLEVDPQGVAQVKMVFDSLKVTTKNEDMEVEFDSSKPLTDNADMVTAILKPLVGSSVTMTVDRAGNISQVSGGEAFSMLGQIVSGSGEGSGSLFGPIFSGRPTDGFAKIGESWEFEDKISSGLIGEFKMTTRHTLRGMMGREAQVNVSGKFEPVTEADGKSSFKISGGQHTGSYGWDTSTGQLAKMETKMSVCLEGTIAEKPMGACTRAMEVKVTRLRK
jgi:hypothetical protein